ncbi:phage shock protein PspA [Desulfovibrio inopinatus]|uniref:phage shock protein PspA n=1 Tax=Desulfovibrio inopinatus TaxID=102109 RepID=UPI000404ADF4|nr:phage shock protein PspA [Desulfovibrio inopinatus]
MGIFSRFSDIVSSNINAMLDKAEDPEKMIRLMIQEMEDTLVELKAACAKTMAQTAKTQRGLDRATEKANLWLEKARLAVEKGREDLAREALVEKRRYEDDAEALSNEVAECQGMVESYRTDIGLLEEKLQSAKDRQRALVQRHMRARGKMRAKQEMRRASSTDTLIRFEQFENRIERLEAEAELAGEYPNRRSPANGEPLTLEEKFSMLEHDDEIERELASLKKNMAGSPAGSSESTDKE